MMRIVESYGSSKSRREVQIFREGRCRYLIEMIARGTIRVTYRRAYAGSIEDARKQARAFRAE